MAEVKDTEKCYEIVEEKASESHSEDTNKMNTEDSMSDVNNSTTKCEESNKSALINQSSDTMEFIAHSDVLTKSPKQDDALNATDTSLIAHSAAATATTQSASVTITSKTQDISQTTILPPSISSVLTQNLPKTEEKLSQNIDLPPSKGAEAEKSPQDNEPPPSKVAKIEILSQDTPTKGSCSIEEAAKPLPVFAHMEGSVLPALSPSPAPSMPGVGGSTKMREIKERAKLRRKLVAQQLGVYSPDRLGEALGSVPSSRQQKGGSGKSRHRRHLPHQTDQVALYTDSTTFLKGTQSANPHNDYCQHFVDTGHRPQNFIRDVGLADRFEEYPKLRELIKLKDDLIAGTASPPCYLKADLHSFPLSSLHTEFDVILVEPPLEEYQHTAPGHTTALKGFWDWNQIRELDIAQVAAPRSFIFLWVGSSEGLDEGRRCLRSWGFRRCEDICWIRTNSTSPGHLKNLDHKAVFQRTKEHCLMGIKGTVRRSTDGDFIHANVDIDLIITEEGSTGTLDKPVEIFHIIEHFCLGKRRLHLFGRDQSIRPGWLTVGPDLSSSSFDPALYASYFNPKSGGNPTTGCTDRIEALRPKSPPPKPGGKTRGGYARGRGRGR